MCRPDDFPPHDELRPGDTVRMAVDAEVATARDESAILPAGTTAKVVRVINDSAVYAKVATRLYIIWTSDLCRT